MSQAVSVVFVVGHCQYQQMTPLSRVSMDVPNHFILLLKAFAPRATSAVVERTVVDSYAGVPFHVAVEQVSVCKRRSITARVWTLEAAGDK